MSYVLIIGAKSDIARALAQEYARQGYDLYLAARNVKELELFANDMTIRHQCEVQLLEFDILNYAAHQDFYRQLPEQPQGIIIAVGLLGDQEKAEHDFGLAEKMFNTNFTGIVSFLDCVVNDFAQRKSGFIIALSSVAGDRGRKANYYYGAAKAALTTYLSGLRNRLYDDHVQVLTVKPGFVNTQMTKDMQLPEKLTAEPEQVARDIVKAQIKGKDLIYTRWVWRYIMWIIKAIPEFQFKKMSI